MTQPHKQPKIFLTTVGVLLGIVPALIASATTSLQDPLGGVSIEIVIGRIVKAILGFSGAIALLMFVWGGLQYLLAGVNAEHAKNAKKTLTSAVYGLVIIFGAYAMVYALVNALSTGSLT